jgi:V/A-type H+-transporting ATPase subunit E
VKDLQSLSEQILNKTKAKGQSKLEDAEKISVAKIEESRLTLVEQQKARKAAILKKVANDFDREQQTLKNKERNAVLKEKQVILKSVFQQALEKMNTWDETHFAQFLNGVLSQADDSKAYSIVPGAKSIAHFKGKELQQLLVKYPAVKISEETIPNKAGFILQESGVDYNYCFDDLIEDVKNDFAAELATLAFQDEK